jgi:hypothetical protein
MAYTFDGPTKLITLSSGTVEFSVLDLYSRWKDWMLLSDNTKYQPAMRTAGGDPISATKNLGATFFLLNGWRIRPQEADHRLTVNGNLYTDPSGSSPFVDTLGAYNVTIEMQVSNLSDSTVAQMDQINAGVYRGVVCLDKTSGYAGDTFPIGTQAFPSNNVAQARTIAANYGIGVLQLQPGTYTFGTGEDLSGMIIKGEHAIQTMVTVVPAANVTNCQFEDLFMVGCTLDGYTYLKHCSVAGLAGFEGFMEGCMIAGTTSLTGTANTYLVDCKSGCVGLGSTDLPVFDLTGTNRHFAFRNWAGPVKLTNSTDAANTLCIDISSGATIIIDASCTAGTLCVRGVGNILDSGSMTVHHEAHLDAPDIAREVISAAQATPIHSEMMKTNGQTIIGDGTEGNKFRSSLVP